MKHKLDKLTLEKIMNGTLIAFFKICDRKCIMIMYLAENKD